MPGSFGVVSVSTARITTEPLWRITSRVAFTPPGSSTSSRVTQKTLPWYTVLDDTVRPRPVSLAGFGAAAADATREATDVFAELFFAGLDFAGAEEVFVLFFEVEVFLVPMTVQYTTGAARSTNREPEDLLHRRSG